MTEAEALRIVANPHLKWKCVEVDSALTIVRNALKKQTAEKPTLLLYVYKCPNCKDNFLRTQQKFCDECGQRLDWSEV